MSRAAVLVVAVTSIGVLPAMFPVTAEAATPSVVRPAGFGSAAPASGSGSGSDGKSSDGKSSDKSSGKSADGEPSDGKSSGGDSSGGDSSGGESADGKSADGKSSEAPAPGADTSGTGSDGKAAGKDRNPTASDPVAPGSAQPAAGSPPASVPPAPGDPSAQPPTTVAAPAIHWQVQVQPGDQTVRAGEKVKFTAKYSPDTAAGVQITVRWQTSRGHDGAWSDEQGAGGAELEVTAGADMDGVLFRAEVSGDKGTGSATSEPVTLHVEAPVDSSCPSTQAAGDPSHPDASHPAKSHTDKPQPDKLQPDKSRSDKPVSGAGTPAPGGATPCPDAATSTSAYGTVADQVIDLGQQQTAVGHNFVPGSKVKVTVEPDGVDLGTVEAAPDGTVTTRFDTSRLLAGQHTVVWTPSAP